MKDDDERARMRAFILLVPSKLPGVLVFERPIVNAMASNARGITWRVKSGVAGQSDLYAIARGGRHVELECKSLTGRMGEKQKAWRARCRELFIPHIVLKANKGESVDEAAARWVTELAGALGYPYADEGPIADGEFGSNPIRSGPWE